ncbi:MAG: ATP-dependent Clp protease ATP-binding subunit [Bacteroidales bacterium]|nr:ATP-dependent Clp protease ATP-binding subunit [Bacteroidales bacterium]
MKKSFTDNAQEVMKNATDEASRLNCRQIETGHIILGILRNKSCTGYRILSELLPDKLAELKTRIEEEIEKYYSTDSVQNQADTPFSEIAAMSMMLARLATQVVRSQNIGTLHILLGVCKLKNSRTKDILEAYGVNYNTVLDTYNRLERQENKEQEENQGADIIRNGIEIFFPALGVSATFPGESISEDQPKASQKRNKRSSNKDDKEKATPYLDNFGKNLSLAASEGKLDPVVGREKETERIIQILSRRKKNNPVLIGEAGLGKSAVVEGIAQRIAAKTVPYTLADKKIYSLDLASVVAGTKYRGQFEERIKGLISELQNHPEIIIFIDEIHTMIGAGGAEGSLDASNILKPALARGEIQCIGATTFEEYRKHFETDKALDRRFQKVQIEPESIEESITILSNIKQMYESFHMVRYTSEAIEACVRLSERYITDRFLPDKAIDVLDEAGAKAHVKNVSIPQEILDLEKEIENIKEEESKHATKEEFEQAHAVQLRLTELKEELNAKKTAWIKARGENPVEIGYEEIAKVISDMTGVEINRVSKDETKRLLEMENILKEKIIGQDEAISKISKAVRRSRTGLKDPNRPIGSFLFVGATGVGKTYLAKMLAEYMFDSQKNLIRIDMSEYMEKFAVSRLIGAPPGYVGYDQAGQLTEKVRQHPYSIILFDEIEKAHRDVFNILLQILDEGHITDSQGRKVDFKNTVIIMTSNVGSRTLQDFGTGVGFSTSVIENNKTSLSQNVINKDIQKTFAPEFLNRIDDIIFFNSLGNKELLQIVDLELKNLEKRIAALGYSLSITQDAKQYLLDKDTKHQFGARPIKRTIQKEIEDPLAELLLEDNEKKTCIEITLEQGGTRTLKFRFV